MALTHSWVLNHLLFCFMQFWLYPDDGGGTKGEVVVGFSLLYWLGKDRVV